ncbi:MAG: chromosome segregation protein SMC [Pirellulales bacterium]
MLKALELVGFKSFADKTRFEFPSGITAIVGPNGSGKSNVVDAIKWVLGEQSVKTLRGKEMVDVIFNGSGSRPPLNSAETTLVFDNSDGLLPIDTPEVHIGRRVYRSGEGEYLINRQPCRLKDVRELFSGTGAATEAYSVIEQGKVDILLQSSPRDRRVIFEEAAGISRFKAKKLESLRRLERVEQNLLRLADIVEEVENQLRHVRKQAAKAHRYRQYSERLQSLRTHVGLTDWRQLGARLAALDAEQGELRGRMSQLRDEATAGEERSRAIDAELAATATATRQCEARVADNRERTAAHETTVEHEHARLRDLEQEQARHREQFTSLSARAGDLRHHWHETATEAATAETEHANCQRQWLDTQSALRELSARLDQVRRDNERRRQSHMDLLKQAAATGQAISARQEQLAQAAAHLQRSREERTALDEQCQTLADERLTAQRELERLVREEEQSQRRRQATERQLADVRDRHATAGEALAETRGHQRAMAERAALLDELIERFEGVGIAAQHLLMRAREETSGPLKQIHGLVADLVRVNIETAPLVDLALGPLAQHLVVGSLRPLLSWLEPERAQLGGRLDLLPLDIERPPLLVDELDLADQPGVLGRADRFVQSAPEHAALVRRLLDRTWFVDTLETALALATSIGRGLQFVTAAGDVITADGAISVGPRVAASGLVSRRSELRALREELTALDATIAADEEKLALLEAEVREHQQQLAAQAAELAAAHDRQASQQSIVAQLDARRAEIVAQQEVSARRESAALAQQTAAGAALTAERDSLRRIEEHLADREAQIAAASREIDDLDARRQTLLEQTTTVQVQLAKSEERLANLRRQLDQLRSDQEERTRALADRHEQLARSLARARQSEANILRCESLLAQLYLDREALGAQQQELAARSRRLANERAAVAEQIQTLRTQLAELDEEFHRHELAASEVRLERATLASRLREDYGIELAELHDLPEIDAQRDAIEEEIADLRRKLGQLGGVNLEALDELAELDRRHQALAGQHEDLSKAKASLEQIIGRINTDSRRLLAETLETVRGHFQGLFRKLFGGGQADIVLEPGADILESGIEIIARPPGKEPRNISLLSGGEKTLTCVALLLAIFRSRPSPFCVLDEVDAALDEANIERFTGVLREFLNWTQFIIVTHSKKTMTCARTLYGVTMQESGVSKRVAVRFDDVSETGEILSPPNRGEAAADERGSDRELDDTDAGDTQAA